MKTSVLMTRQMGNFDVFQRTSDGYFDANALSEDGNFHNMLNGMV